METAEKPQRAIVTSMGKESGAGGSFEGAHCEATLVSQLRPNSEYWFVSFAGDRDLTGHQLTRLRKLVSLIS